MVALECIFHPKTRKVRGMSLPSGLRPFQGKLLENIELNDLKSYVQELLEKEKQVLLIGSEFLTEQSTPGQEGEVSFDALDYLPDDKPIGTKGDFRGINTGYDPDATSDKPKSDGTGKKRQKTSQGKKKTGRVGRDQPRKTRKEPDQRREKPKTKKQNQKVKKKPNPKYEKWLEDSLNSTGPTVSIRKQPGMFVASVKARNPEGNEESLVLIKFGSKKKKDGTRNEDGKTALNSFVTTIRRYITRVKRVKGENLKFKDLFDEATIKSQVPEVQIKIRKLKEAWEEEKKEVKRRF